MTAFLKHVLWATDYSEESECALVYADLFAKAFGARLSALHVTPDFSPVLYESAPAIEAEFTGKVAAAAAAADARIQEISRARGIRFDSVLIRKGSPAKAICEAIEKDHADLVVLGITGFSRSGQTAIGSVANHVLRSSTVPVLVTGKSQKQPAIGKILVPTDFSPHEDRERDVAWRLAKGLKSSLRFLYVVELFGHDFRLPEELFGAMLEKLRARKKKEHEDIAITEDVYKAHQASEGIVDYAQTHGYDLIVMSTHAGPVKRFFMGSTTERVVSTSRVPVFAIPPQG
jgi:nucleotide-binding universal stress UspA family protein